MIAVGHFRFCEERKQLRPTLTTRQPHLRLLTTSKKAATVTVAAFTLAEEEGFAPRSLCKRHEPFGAHIDIARRRWFALSRRPLKTAYPQAVFFTRRSNPSFLQHYTLQKKRGTLAGTAFLWRRRRDSNPRTACDGYTISSRAPSTRLGDSSVCLSAVGGAGAPYVSERNPAPLPRDGAVRLTNKSWVAVG